MGKLIKIFIGIVSFLQSPLFQKFFLFLKGFFIFSSLLLLVFVIFFLFKTDILRWYFLEDLIEFLSFKSYFGRKQLKRWKKVKKWISSGKEDDLKVAIIEANRMLHEALIEREIKGKDVLEKLENISPKLLPPELFGEIKNSFEVYRNIIEDPSFKISQKEARKVIEGYEKALKELGFIE